MTEERDYAAEMRAVIDSETSHGPYVSRQAAADIVEKLRANDPHLLDGWLSQPAALFHVYDARWQCTCGRFLAETAIHSEDAVDPGAYYGVSSRIWADCPRCGEVESPRLVTVAERPIYVLPPDATSPGV